MISTLKNEQPQQQPQATGQDGSVGCVILALASIAMALVTANGQMLADTHGLTMTAGMVGVLFALGSAMILRSWAMPTFAWVMVAASLVMFGVFAAGFVQFASYAARF